MSDITGLHHVTAICGDAQENLDFYAGVLGMRLVKKTVNQDVPGTYHLFYADGEAHPGTDLTFFPWPDLPPAKRGHGVGAEIALAIPPRTIEYWSERIERYGARVLDSERRHDDRAITFADPHGQPLALVETAEEREFAPWRDSPVSPERQIRGLQSVRAIVRELSPTTTFLTDVLGFRYAGEENGWHRYGVGSGGSGAHVELCEVRDSQRGAWGVGIMHHVAWRVPDEETQIAVRERVAAARRRPTEVIDRFWFKSVYFLEPGGVLFELATDGPGFTLDEDVSELGEHLVLAPWLEPRRAEIERGLQPLSAPQPQLFG